MAFKDFKGRNWTVLGEPLPGLGAKHGEDDVVTFHGDENKVIVKCQRYEAGRYDENGDRIVGDGYTITKIATPGGGSQIMFSPTAQVPESGPVGGSWTAEDTGSGAGGDGE